MEKDLIFFGETGLTNTSANFVANMAKEMYATSESYLDNMVFYDTTVKLIGTSEETPINKGTDDTTWIPQTMKEIAQLKSLIEPVMIIFLAAVVGVVLLAVIVPMFSMYEQIA